MSDTYPAPGAPLEGSTVLDDRTIFAMVTGSTPPRATPSRLRVLPGVTLIVVGVASAAVAWPGRLGEASAYFTVAAVVTVIAAAGLGAMFWPPSVRPTEQENTAYNTGSALMRQVALDRFGVAFSPENNATWLMRYGDTVDFGGRARLVKVVREADRIALVADGRKLEPLDTIHARRAA